MLKTPMMIYICQLVAGVGLISYFLLPRNMEISFHVSSNLGVGLPLRWCVSVALITIAGLIGIGSLMKMYWSLTHFPYLR
jgi:hypothetical protein